jgi:AraC-like DNA-binding protein
VPRDDRELGSAWTRYQRHDFPDPAPDLARYVVHYWTVSWRYREPYQQKIVPYPDVHLTFQEGRATVQGPSARYQVKVLSGESGVLGVRFRPGCFRPFLGAPVSTLAERSVDAREIFGPDVPTDPDVPAVEDFLRAHLPEPDPRADEAATLVAAIATTPGLTRVDKAAAEAGLGVRALQRLFAEYVGIGPKWVIRRYRLHEVTERLAAGAEIDWAVLAAELGYADQAHFVRDFRTMFGESPTWYAARY